MSGNTPLKKFKVGSVNATVWKNKRPMGNRVVDVFSVSLSRNYLENGEWKSTSSFGTNDLQKVLLAVGRAQEFLLCGKETSEGDGGEDGQSSSSSN